MDSRRRRLATAAALLLGVLLSFGCRGKASIAPGLTEGALMTLRNGMSSTALRATLAI